MLCVFIQNIGYITYERMRQLTLPSGQLNFIHLFERQELSNPLVVYNNYDPEVPHAEAVILVIICRIIYIALNWLVIKIHVLNVLVQRRRPVYNSTSKPIDT